MLFETLISLDACVLTFYQALKYCRPVNTKCMQCKTKPSHNSFIHTRNFTAECISICPKSSTQETLKYFLLMTHLISHNHRGTSMNSQNRKLCLNRQEIQDLGNGLLICAISKHKSMETSSRHKLTHLKCIEQTKCFTQRTTHRI